MAWIGLNNYNSLIMIKKYFFSFVVLALVACHPTDNLPSCKIDQQYIQWHRQADIPIGERRIVANTVVHNNKAYLMSGHGGGAFVARSNILCYSNNSWNIFGVYNGWANGGGSGTWLHNNLIYSVGGRSGSNAPTDEVSTISLTTNRFNKPTTTPSGSIFEVSSCNTSTKGYFGYGIVYDSTYQSQIANEIWSYDFASGNWHSINLPPNNPNTASSKMVSENDVVYLLFSDQSQNNFYKFDESTDTWIKLADFPGVPRTSAVLVSTETDIYTGCGITNDNNSYSLHKDIWKYNIRNDTWIEFCQYPGKAFHAGFAFRLDNALYFGGGATESIISDPALNKELYKMTIH